MDRDLLVGELKELHRGRGIRRPAVQSWLGPTLADCARLTDTTPDEDARTALVALLGRHLERFPADLRQLFRVASGIAADEPFLEQRLARVAEGMHLSERGLRRRLREAEQLLADAILAEASPMQGYAARGWQWADHQMNLRLGEQAHLTFRRRVQALADYQKYVVETIVIPNWDAGDSIEFEGRENFDLVSCEQPSPGRWDLTWQLPRTLRRGQTLDTELRTTLSRARAMLPVLALTPIRQLRALTIRVDFGTPPVASRAWIVRDVPAIAFSVGQQGDDLISTDESHEVTATFDNMAIGMVYGIAWEWAD